MAGRRGAGRRLDTRRGSAGEATAFQERIGRGGAPGALNAGRQKSQFLRLWKYFHGRNYDRSLIIDTLSGAVAICCERL
jgi:hypothetical protein